MHVVPLPSVPAAVTLSSAPRPAPATIVFAHRAGRDWIRGSEQCLLDLVRGLDAARFRSVVICDAPALVRAATDAGAEAVNLDVWGHGPLRPPAVRRHLAALLRTHGASLVHVNTPGVLPAILPGARACRVPVVAHLHLPSGPVDRLHALIHQADAIVGVSRAVLEPFRAEAFPPDRLHLIYNGVDVARLAAPTGVDATAAARALRASLGVGPNAMLAAAIGSLIRRKGHDVSIRSVAAARARGADVHLAISGDGEEEGALRALAAELGVASYVHLLGYRGDVGAVLRAADLVVTSAREETLGLNVLEAQTLGRAVVASDIPPHREALSPDVTGVLVPVENDEALGAMLAALAADAATRERLGNAGPAFVSDRFAMRRYVTSFEALYTSLLARPRARYGWPLAVVWPRAYTRWAAQLVAARCGFRRAG